MPDVLTILGASARAAAQSAGRAGFRPHAGDLFADADLQRVCRATRVGTYPAGLIDVCAGPQPGAWMYTGALENHPELLARMAALRPLWGNDAETVRHARDPCQVAQVLQRAHLPGPAVAHSPQGLPRDGSWLRKSILSAGGNHVVPWTNQTVSAKQPSTQYFQERIEGVDCSAVYVAARGQAALVGATRQIIGPNWPGAAMFRYVGSIGPLPLTTGEQSQLNHLGQALAEAFDLRGVFGVDLVHNSEGFWPVEMNPRYTASIEVLERALQINAVAWHVAACRDHRLPEDTWHRQAKDSQFLAEACRGKAIVYAPRDGVASTSIEALVDQADASDGWPLYADIPPSGTMIRQGSPLLTVFAAGPNERLVIEQLRRQTEYVTGLWSAALPVP